MRNRLFTEIAEMLLRFNAEIKNQNQIGRTDLNYVAEEIYGVVLNIVLDCNLKNVRYFQGGYQAIDLADESNGLAVQVTSNNNRMRIQHTLDRFLEARMEERYQRLIVLVIGNGRQYKNRFDVRSVFDFDASRDIWDEKRLLHEIESLDITKLKKLRDYLCHHMPGLAKPKLEISNEDNIDHKLDGIIRSDTGLRDMIDRDLLYQNTVYCNYGYLVDENMLQTVGHLFVIASAEQKVSMPVREGCYISQDNTWLMLVGLSSEQVTAAIKQCTNLTSLEIVHHNLEEISLDHLQGLKNLKICENSKPIHFTGNRFLASLERFCVRASQLADILDFKSATQLRELIIDARTGGSVRLEGLDWCGKMDNLELHKAEIDMIDLDRLSNLKMLYLSGMDTEIRVKNNHNHLTKLWLYTCNVASLTFLPRLKALDILIVFGSMTPVLGLDVPDLSMSKKLTKVSFEHTKLHTVRELPSQISELNLLNTGLSRIPDSVKSMKDLKTLDLNGLYLRELPEWLADLKLPVRVSGGLWLTGILMESTRVEGVDLRTIPEQQELLKEWLEALRDARNQTQNEVKVIFLGDGEAGKSHIIKRLENDGAVLQDFNGDATPGIAITNKTLDLTDRAVLVRAWDFGGQEILHAMHRIFMTEQSLFVVVLNARNDTQDHRAEHWLRFIYSFDKYAQVLLVLNKIDQNPRASININRLKRMFPGLADVVKMSAKEDTPVEFTEHFIQPLKQQLERFEELKTPFPKSWRRLEEKLEGVKDRYIREREYKKLCEEAGIDKAEVRNELVYRFMNLGICFRCDEETWTKSFLLLEPRWVTNAIYKILFNHHDKAFNGIISVADIQDCLIDGETPWSVEQNLSYNEDEVNYILHVMRSYGLSFQMDDEHESEFIPMLCDRNESQLMKEFVDDPRTLEILWEFNYLPDNLLFHLMVEQSGELDTDHVWLSGASFQDSYTQHCMIVERDGNTLKLFAENKPGQDSARRHMESMERNLRKVIDTRFPGMVEQKRDNSCESAVSMTWMERYPGIRRMLVHKVNGRRETFDLNRLEDNKNCLQYSQLLKTTILAKDLLEWSYRGMDPEQSKLVLDLIEGCMDVQANRNSHENPRNTYVRDVLRAKQYYTCDQTLCGKAEGQNEAGELDMEIRRDAGKPWTIFEALNHSDYDTWKRHLNKLLTNYNPHRMKTLFLVVYIDNKDFTTITSRYGELVKAHAPSGFSCIGESAEEMTDVFASDVHGVKVWRCHYESNTGAMTVYHIFVHMDKPIESNTSKKNTVSKQPE